MTVRTLMEALDELFPFAASGAWDPVGLQIGDEDAPTGTVGVTHEVTRGVVEQVLDSGISTIVAYHPLLFTPTTEIVAGPTAEGRALALARGGVSVISIHTAFDVANPGTADAFLAALGLAGEGTFAPVDDDGGAHIGRFATLREPTTVGALRTKVEAVTGSPTRANASDDHTVGSVGVIPGSGGSFLSTVGALDAVITGDVSHHEAAQAQSAGLVVIDAGHIPSERPGFEALYAAVCTVVPDAVRIADNPNPWED